MKNNNPYTGGIPDYWYSGKRDLWVEYKYLPKVPVRKIVKPLEMLSALQIDWINGRSAEGRSIVVIIGCPDGGVVLSNGMWNTEFSPQEFCSLIRSKKEVAEAITASVS